ncbi:MAG: hypothetical protein HKO57_02000 [Akkermansiaceae bacterium]|nr:hypothetical protein [Akkermansiaceae bacterium]
MLLASFLPVAGAGGARAATRLARVFDDHMVLQRGAAVAVFGTDRPGQAVRVTFAGQRKQTTTGRDGRWRLDLDPLRAATTGRTLTAVGSSTHRIAGVLVGEVWLAAGQSNMDWTVKQAATAPRPANFPLIRMANWIGTVDTGARTVYGPDEFARLTPAAYYGGTWERLDAASVLPQSAVAWFFADHLAEFFRGRGSGIPVGIVDISCGGTLTEAFIPPDALRADRFLRAAFEDPRGARTTGQWAASRIARNLGPYTHRDPAVPHPHPYAPGFLYATGLAHLVPFTFRGVIWYQGESNAEFTAGPYQWNGARLADYQHMVMQTLVRSWREAFENAELPFLMVQLPRIRAPNRVLWPWYREAQARVADGTPGVELAVVTGFGADGPNVHPAAKEPVGRRLARLARGRVYREALPVSGPRIAAHAVDGGTVTLTFDELGGGLVDNDGGTLRNFEVAGADRAFVPATAVIAGDSVEVRAPGVARPVAVRHAWDMNPDIDLFNSAGLPAAPFRTDSWIVAPGRPVRIACIGDSITAGHGLAAPAKESYPARLAGLLDATRFDVRGFGTTGAGIHRPANKFDRGPEFAAALAFAPDIVICNLGINDVTHWGTYTRADFLAAYRKLIDAFAASGNAPLIITWHPLAPLFPGQKFFGDPHVATLNQWIADAAALTGVLTLDMRAPLAGHPEWFPDMLHPNAAGARAIAKETARFLRSLEARPPSP